MPPRRAILPRLAPLRRAAIQARRGIRALARAPPQTPRELRVARRAISRAAILRRPRPPRRVARPAAAAPAAAAVEVPEGGDEESDEEDEAVRQRGEYRTSVSWNFVFNTNLQNAPAALLNSLHQKVVNLFMNKRNVFASNEGDLQPTFVGNPDFDNIFELTYRHGTQNPPPDYFRKAYVNSLTNYHVHLTSIGGWEKTDRTPDPITHRMPHFSFGNMSHRHYRIDLRWGVDLLHLNQLSGNFPVRKEHYEAAGDDPQAQLDYLDALLKNWVLLMYFRMDYLAARTKLIGGVNTYGTRFQMIHNTVDYMQKNRKIDRAIAEVRDLLQLEEEELQRGGEFAGEEDDEGDLLEGEAFDEFVRRPDRRR